MKKVIALVAFAAFLSVNTFAQETKVISDKKAPAATEKASCCSKSTATASCCKNNKEAKACTHEQKAACAKESKSSSIDAPKAGSEVK